LPIRQTPGFVRCLLAASLLISTLYAAPAAAKRASPFEIDLRVELPLLTAAVAIWLTPQFIATDLGAPACDPCDPAQLNGLDRAVINFSSTAAKSASDVLVGVIPALAAGATLLNYGRYGGKSITEDLLILAEVLAISGAMHQVVRFAVRRPRPFMYVAGKYAEDRDAIGSTLSFYSGHTSIAFAMATAGAYLYTIRNPRSRYAALVWTGALLGAGAVGYSRVAAGRHFWTDAIAGAVVGTAVGLLVPALHLKKKRKVKLTLGPSGAGLGLMAVY